MHGILLLDKPAGGSSNHALQKAKRLFGARKAGHTGSLDPLATGMLPVCFGEATKISAYLLDADKGYETTLKLGETTDSADSDGKLLESRPVPAELDEAEFKRICDTFKGPIQQIPPMVSAIKIDGQRLYKLARQGEIIERPSRSVTIHSLEVLSFSENFARLAVRCSKGTYIRSLVSDIGELIGCGAHVTALRRTFVSPFEQRPMIETATLEQMVAQLSDVEPNTETVAESVAQNGAGLPDEALAAALDSLLLPVDAALGHLPTVCLLSGEEHVFSSGQSAACIPAQAEVQPLSGTCRVYAESGLLLGLGEMDASDMSDAADAPEPAKRVAPRRVFQWN